MKNLFAALLVTLFSALSGHAQTLAYMAGDASPELDVYSFDGADNAPIMIYVHGGAWMIGDKRQVRDKPAFFNENGYVFVSVNYTLVPRGTVEQQMAEVDAAIGYITDNAARFGGDPRNISLMGHSAGAYLATMSVLKPLSTMQDWLLLGSLKAVISNDVRGYDLLNLQSQFPNGVFSGAYAEVFGQERSRLVSLSPQLYLGGDAMDGAVPAGVPLPPFLVTYSGGRLREELSLSFAEALRGDGTEVRVFFGEGYTHGEMNKRFGMEGPLTDVAEAFLALAYAVETF